ncbi:MAG: hypothetical protein JSV99_11825 [Planctomycetota bacterium]|nr:MAG: hypothetical protein JSV99_11825 [Planctomycetota bacterium]
MVETVRMVHDKQGTRSIKFFSTDSSAEDPIVYVTENIQAKYDNLTGAEGGEDCHRVVLGRLSE